MNCSATGKIIEVGPISSGLSGNGKTWKRRSFVIEEDAQYSPKVEFKIFGDKVDTTDLPFGGTVKVDFSIESNKHNDRWFTECKAYRVEVLGRPQQRQQSNDSSYDDDIKF